MLWGKTLWSGLFSFRLFTLYTLFSYVIIWSHADILSPDNHVTLLSGTFLICLTSTSDFQPQGQWGYHESDVLITPLDKRGPSLMIVDNLCQFFIILWFDNLLYDQKRWTHVIHLINNSLPVLYPLCWTTGAIWDQIVKLKDKNTVLKYFCIASLLTMNDRFIWILLHVDTGQSSTLNSWRGLYALHLIGAEDIDPWGIAQNRV